MMNAVIIEDELPAVNRLIKLIEQVDPEIQIIQTIDSIEDTIKWFSNNTEPTVIFLDIELADGLSFEIFKHINIKCPIIFTTAYDQYAIQAFKVNSIDYLLKPIDEIELTKAIKKLKSFSPQINPLDYKKITDYILAQSQHTKYKERFISKVGDQLKLIEAKNIAFFYSELSYSYLHTYQNKSFIIDMSLDQIEKVLDPSLFYRINRKNIVSLPVIKNLHSYFNSRLKIELNISTNQEFIVSRERVTDFKIWLNQ